MAERMFASEDESVTAGRLEPNGRWDGGSPLSGSPRSAQLSTPSSAQSSLPALSALSATPLSAASSGRDTDLPSLSSDDAQAGVARRLQGRLDRHLWLLDRMQNDPLVSEPPGLEELLEIGKRMRRDTESLLLLAGHEPGVRSGRARRLADVLADATAAAEEPRRVEVRNPTAAGIAPAAATELLHIVAELIDYVTAVYPGARVDISSRTEPPGGIAVEVRAEGAGRYDPEGLGGRRALGAAERLARRSHHGIGLRLPGVTTGLVASVHVPGAAVELDEPERSLPWAGGASAQDSARSLPRRNGNGNGGTVGRSIRDANPFGEVSDFGSGSYGPVTNGNGNGTGNGAAASNGAGGALGGNGGRSPGLPARPAAYQPSGQHPIPPPLQHSQPMPLQHSQPTPLQHSQPMPLPHSQPTPLQHSQPMPLQHSQPTPLQHSQPVQLSSPSLPASLPLPSREPRKDQSRLDQSRLDQSRLDQPRLDQPRLDQPRLDQLRQDQLRHDPPRLDPLRHDPFRDEPLRHDPVRLDPLRDRLKDPLRDPIDSSALVALPEFEKPQSPVDELFGPLLDLAHDPADDSVATPIFEAIASAWFREDAPAGETALDRPATPAGKDPLDWETPSDSEWREAAARAARPEPTPQTAGGLPRRRPGSQLVPPPRNRKPLPDIGPAERVPDRVRDRLSTYQRGLREGRHRAEPPKEKPRTERDPFDPEAW